MDYWTMDWHCSVRTHNKILNNEAQNEDMVLDSLDSSKSSLERLPNSVHSLLIQRFSQLVSAILHVKSSEYRGDDINVPATYCNEQ